MQNDKAKDVTPLCAERHAHSNLVRALHDEERHDAVNSDGGENERDRGKNSEQHDREMSRRDGFGDHLLKRAHVGNRLRGIDCLNFAADRIR